ncbi:Ros/MucR family transcriptional regulator [Komagataeibacter swingsii DSM 16373]|uniref:MucR family transcriptional regulator n=1 Tax=Komagataeibacter diospyri TaxID=1932662 RepID=A0A4P5NW21_9PROT|nr:Ros/MucR family transcriptional regulator [Komagataeibacter swingsii DSM 16373]GCE81624.1 MucR family transcriptional regulator [Komagataeibacter oboediens]GCE84131.1 MucR family transcriptional regulator [Komagataeibacter diospyri]
MRELTTRIVTAYVSSHTVPADTLPGLIATVFQALGSLGQATTGTPDLVPAVPVKKSVFPDYIVCLEDGKKLKMLKRHLQSAYGMTPQQYREKWGLPESYPMVAPDYAARRSALAQEIGLGRTIKATPEPSHLPEAEAPVTRLPEKKRGRRPKLA